MFKIVANGLVRKVAQAVVVTIIAHLGGQLGLGAEGVLPFLGEQAI